MRIAFLLAMGLASASPQARADSNEDRLRDALRQSVTQMRAAQDQAAQAQADLQKAQQDKAAVEAQLNTANAKLAETPSKPVLPAPELGRMQAELQAGRAQNAALQQALAKTQHAYQGAAEQARALDGAARHAQAGLTANTGALATCRTENKRLVDMSEDILHLYGTQSFRSLLLRSYEPLIGAAKVKLENMIQDYDDKIRQQEYVAEPRRD